MATPIQQNPLLKIDSPASQVTLKDLQRWLSKIITHPRGTEAALREMASNVDNTSASTFPILDFIIDEPPINRGERLDIYAEGYFARLFENLSTDFENLVRLMSELFDVNAFRKIVSAYLELHPSRTRTVGDVGQHLPQFLRNYSAVQNFPFLAEVAEMDWRATRALYIDSAPPFDPAGLATLTEDEWPCLQFELDPSVQWFYAEHSITRVWNAEHVAISMIEAQPEWVLVHRQQEFVYVQPMTPVQAQVLKSMKESKSLGEICDTLDASQSENVMTWFGAWIGSGVIKNAGLRLHT